MAQFFLIANYIVEAKELYSYVAFYLDPFS